MGFLPCGRRSIDLVAPRDRFATVSRSRMLLYLSLLSGRLTLQVPRDLPLLESPFPVLPGFMSFHCPLKGAEKSSGDLECSPESPLHITGGC